MIIIWQENFIVGTKEKLIDILREYLKLWQDESEKFDQSEHDHTVECIKNLPEWCVMIANHKRDFILCDYFVPDSVYYALEYALEYGVIGDFDRDYDSDYPQFL